VYDLFVRLCHSVLPVTLADTDRARLLLASGAGVSVRDAIHAAVMLNNNVQEIATFDAGFDRLPDIRRLMLD
jgi:predicted nucleic acid-binding protein